MNKESTTVAIKGIKNGILVDLSPTEAWLQITGDLAARIDEQSSFFQGAKITINLGERPVPKHELTGLKALLERRGLTIWSIMSESATTIEAAHTLDLKTNVANTVPKPRKETRTEDPLNCLFIRRTLRSGQTIESKGHAVIYGDVNPGAKVIAVGDVIVWGRIRGMVHAGTEGDPEAVVCALDMQPTQLRIADHIVTSPEDKRRKPKPEIARIRDQQIVVEVWQ